MERTGWTGKTVTLKYKLNTYQGGPWNDVLWTSVHSVDSVYEGKVLRPMDLYEERRLVCGTLHFNSFPHYPTI